MVARGDLGVELPLEKIFIAQKMMISKCNASGKPVITATQMLESMIQNPRPTRAEATDVANAVLDGSDCVMLSGETASGEFPVEAVQYMSRISKQAEAVERRGDYPSMFEALKEVNKGGEVPEVVASYAVRVANDLKAAVIVTISETGKTSRLICKYRPRVPVICVTNSHATANYLIYVRAAIPFLVDSVKGTERLIVEALEKAKNQGHCKKGDLVVVCSGIVEGHPGNTNSLRVISVDSIFETILISFPFSPRTSLICLISSADLIKEAAMESTPFWTPNKRSALSLSDNAGRVTLAPGRCTFLFSPNTAVLFITQWHTFFSLSIDWIVREIFPSAIKITPLMWTELTRSW